MTAQPQLSPHAPRKAPRALRLRDFPGVAPVAIFGIVFLYVPIIITTVYAFNAGDSALVWKGFSVRWFGEVAQNANLLNSVWVSLQIAVVATLVATVFSILFALSVERLRAKGSAIVWGAVVDELPPIGNKVTVVASSPMMTYCASSRESDPWVAHQ